jgi:hypothetical protein
MRTLPAVMLDVAAILNPWIAPAFSMIPTPEVMTMLPLGATSAAWISARL